MADRSRLPPRCSFPLLVSPTTTTSTTTTTTTTTTKYVIMIYCPYSKPKDLLGFLKTFQQIDRE